MPKKKKEEEQKTKGQLLTEELTFKTKLIWEKDEEKEWENYFSFADDYKKFLDAAKTERESIDEARKIAEEFGFKPYEGGKFKGDKLFYELHNKTCAFIHLGKKDIKEGVKIVVSHVDAPRIDLKQNPLYEDVDLAMMKTHYYGGIKKYQWVNVPLAIHGVVVKNDGSVVKILEGERMEDPVFVLPDLLPHLARKTQYTKKAADIVPAEKMNLIAGSIPFIDDKAESKIKLNVLRILNEKYGITEKDFLSAEIELVPSEKARDVGFDKSLLGAYGQDDRVCAYTSVRAIIDMTEKPEYTSIVYLADKEEIGSDGNSGANSFFIVNLISELLASSGSKEYNDLHKTLKKSEVLSSDVNAAINPNFQEVQEKMNACKVGYGVCVTKFTGSGGKYSSNDAHSEFMRKILNIFDDNNVFWQTGELGKVDEGGGGTIAKYMSQFGMNVIDCGPPVLGMHSPFEVTSKADVYHTYKAYKAFLESK